METIKFLKDYTDEQKKALEEYSKARTRLADAQYIVSTLEIAEEEEVDLEGLRIKAKELRLRCKELNINIV